MKTYPPDSVLVTGVARVSKEDAINAMYGTFTLSLVVDVKRFYNLFWGAKVTVQMRVLSAPTFFSIKK